MYPESNLCLKTMSMLSRSISVVLRSSIRTVEAMLSFLYQLSKTPLYGYCHQIPLPLPKWFLLSILSWISCSTCPWEGYTPGICVKHIFLSIVLFDLMITFSFPLICLTFLVIHMISVVVFFCLCKHLGVQPCQ